MLVHDRPGIHRNDGFLELSCPHSTILLTPPVEGLLCDANLPDRINTRHTLADKHLNLPYLGHYLFRFVSLIRDNQRPINIKDNRPPAVLGC